MERGQFRYDLRVDLARPRARDIRYGPRFNELCLELRKAMGASP
jgi:NitT/TauT family transport system ATP-binding protein